CDGTFLCHDPTERHCLRSIASSDRKDIMDLAARGLAQDRPFTTPATREEEQTNQSDGTTSRQQGPAPRHACFRFATQCLAVSHTPLIPSVQVPIRAPARFQAQPEARIALEWSVPPSPPHDHRRNRPCESVVASPL